MGTEKPDLPPACLGGLDHAGQECAPFAEIGGYRCRIPPIGIRPTPGAPDISGGKFPPERILGVRRWGLYTKPPVHLRVRVERETLVLEGQGSNDQAVDAT